MNCYISQVQIPTDDIHQVMHTVEQELMRARAARATLCVLPYSFAAALEVLEPQRLSSGFEELVKSTRVSLLYPIYEFVKGKRVLSCYLQTKRGRMSAKKFRYQGISFACILEGSSDLDERSCADIDFAFYMVETPFSLHALDVAGASGYELSRDSYRRFDECVRKIKRPLVIVSGIGVYRDCVFPGESFVLQNVSQIALASELFREEAFVFSVTKDAPDRAKAADATDDIDDADDRDTGEELQDLEQVLGSFARRAYAHRRRHANANASENASSLSFSSCTNTRTDTSAKNTATVPATSTSCAHVPGSTSSSTLPPALSESSVPESLASLYAASHAVDDAHTCADKAYCLCWDALVYALKQTFQVRSQKQLLIVLDGTYASFLLCLLACDAGLRAYVQLIACPRLISRELNRLSTLFAQSLQLECITLDNISFGHRFETLADKTSAREWAYTRQIRMQASALDARVLSGITKTARLLKWGSFFDECSDLAPFGDLLETELVRVGACRLKRESGIYERIRKLMPKARETKALPVGEVSAYTLDVCINYVLNLTRYGSCAYASTIGHPIDSFAATTPQGKALFEFICSEVQAGMYNRFLSIPCICVGGLPLRAYAVNELTTLGNAASKGRGGVDVLKEIMGASSPSGQILISSVSSPEEIPRALSELLSSAAHSFKKKPRRRRLRSHTGGRREEQIDNIVEDILESCPEAVPESFYIIDNRLNPAEYVRTHTSAAFMTADPHAAFADAMDAMSARDEASAHLRGVLSILRDFCKSSAFCTHVDKDAILKREQEFSQHMFGSLLDSNVGELTDRLQKNPFSEN